MNLNTIFDSERINFVKISEDLGLDYLNMVNDPEVQKFISRNSKTYTFQEEVEWVKQKLSENACIFSMIEKDTNEFIGNIEIMSITNNIGELGISITPQKQNKHYGQESIKRMISYAFDELNLDGLELNVYDCNHRGIRCYEKVGFVVDSVGKTNEDIHMVIKK